MLTGIVAALVVLTLAPFVLIAVARVRERRRRHAWLRHRAAMQRYQLRILPRELFRRWHPKLMLTDAARADRNPRADAATSSDASGNAGLRRAC